MRWRAADAALALLEDPLTTGQPDGIPFGVAVGNHDQSPIDRAGPLEDLGQTTVFYNQFFGRSRFCSDPVALVCREYYGGSYSNTNVPTNNDNHYQLFSAGGMDFIVIHLEYNERRKDLLVFAEWAEAVLTLHPHRRAIVVSHFLIEAGYQKAWSNQGRWIFDSLRDRENLFLMLAGHRPGEGRRVDEREDGRPVWTLEADYQEYPNGGDGWLRVLTFSPERNLIQVETHSPWRDAFETDADSKFKIAYDMGGGELGSETILLKEGLSEYTGTSDTSLSEDSPSSDAGNDRTFEWDSADGAGAEYGLLRFADLFQSDGGPIPLSATILAASLSMTVTKGGDPADVHEVLVEWDEYATWNDFGGDPGVQADEISAKPVASVDGAPTRQSIDVTAAVQAWASAPESNRGWVFLPRGPRATQVASRDHKTPFDRPELMISFLDDGCVHDDECHDGKACTLDACLDGRCSNTETLECSLLDTPQTAEQQRCINELNANLTKVAEAQHKLLIGCVEARGMGESAVACAASPSAKLEAARARAEAQEERWCGVPPDFGATDTASVFDAAIDAGAGLLADVYGADLDAALHTRQADADGARCQAHVARALLACERTWLEEFNRCKKEGLKSESIQNVYDLATCVGGDPRGTIDKACDAALTDKVLRPRCVDRAVDLEASFPGCAAGGAEDLGACMREAVDCRACAAVTRADALYDPCAGCEPAP